MQRKIVRKKMNFAEVNIPQSEIIKLIELQGEVGSAFIHDANNYVGKVVNWAYMSKTILAEVPETQLDGKVRQSINTFLTDIEGASINFLGVIKSIFASTRDNPSGNLASKPLTVVEEIMLIFGNINISIDKKASRTMEFIYPENIFEIIVRECLSNSVKHNKKNNFKIFVSWGMRKSKFFLEIHDNGKGIISELSQEYLPFGHIFEKLQERKVRVGGLRFINKLIRNSGGNLYVSRSQRLGGTMIYIELPTFAYYKAGRIYETK